MRILIYLYKKENRKVHTHILVIFRMCVFILHMVYINFKYKTEAKNKNKNKITQGQSPPKFIT